MDTATREKMRGELQYREMKMDRSAIDVQARTVRLSFSSEAPAARWWGVEILSHDPADVDLTRLSDGAALLLNHDWDVQVGVIDSCSVDPDKMGRALTRFSRSVKAEEIFVDVQDAIRGKTSVGYMVTAEVEIKPEDMSEEVKSLCLSTGLKAYRCKWMPYEVSIVSVPMDVKTGVGRSAEVATPQLAKDEDTITIKARGGKMDEVKTPSPEELAKKMAEAEGAIKSARKAEIEALASRYAGRVPKVDEMRDAAIREGIDGAEFKGRLFDALPQGERFESPVGELGLSEKEKKQFSVVRLLAHAAGDKDVNASFELECSREVEKRLGGKSKPNSVVLPFDIADTLNRRDLSYAGGATAGANLVGTNLQPNEWQAMLRAKSVAAQIGVRRVSVSGGNITFPRQTGATTAYWPGETGGFTESSQTFGLVTAMPNEVGTYTEVSRRLLTQGTPSVEMIVRDDLIQTIMLSEETQLFSGAGTNYPTGIINTSGVGTVTAANIGWTGAVEFETDIQTANAYVQNMWYAFNAAGAGILKTREKASGHPVYLMGDDRRMNGYGVAVSNLVASGYGFFGDWSKALLITWGAIEIVADPYSLATTGMVRFNVFHLMDVGILQPSAFTFCSDLS